MATLLQRPGKTPGYEIRFYTADGRRHSIYLGGRRYNKKTAQGLKDVVESLVFHRDNSLPIQDKRIIVWIESASQEIQKKLVKAGLIEIPQSHTVTELWDEFLVQKANEVKKSTMAHYFNAKNRFLLFFKEDESLSDITKERMQRWKDYLLVHEKLAKATVANSINDAKAAFNWAVSSGWIEKNPLDGVSRGSFVNKKNAQLIPMDANFRMLDACPCQDWRVILALTRIGGLRCPNEVLALRWENVNWELDRFFVRSSKTEHHDGKEGR